MKIAITGSFGTGKTTHLFELAKEYKLKNPDKSIGIIQEIARFCPYPVNEDATFEAQMWIFCNQMKSEIEYKKLYDITICDRTLFDSVAYAMVNGNKAEAISMYQLALHHASTYDRIIFRTIDKSDFLIEDGFRSQNKIFRADVENELVQMYTDINKLYPLFNRTENEYGFELTRKVNTSILNDRIETKYGFELKNEIVENKTIEESSITTLKTKNQDDEYKDFVIRHDKIRKQTIPAPPKPPAGRICKQPHEFFNGRCPMCRSTLERVWFMNKKCINKDCGWTNNKK